MAPDHRRAAQLVAAYAPDVEAVLGQIRVDAKATEHKAALELPGVLPLRGRVVTADAMFTHRDVCTAVLDGGGDSILPAKENQPNLLRDIQAAFAEPPAGLSPLQAGRRAASFDRARESDKGHGRVEVRSLEATTWLAEYLASDWPGCAGVPPGPRASIRRRGRARGDLRDHQPAARAGRGGGAVPVDPGPLGD